MHFYNIEQNHFIIMDIILKTSVLFVILNVQRIMVVATVVDLSHPFENTTLHWPIYDPFEFNIIQRGWYELPSGRIWAEFNDFATAEHVGTHMDAPCHIARGPNKWRLHQIPPERFLGDAVVVDISDRASKDPDTILTVSDLENWEKEYGQIKDGSIVLMYSGWDQYWGNETAYFGKDTRSTSQYHFPGIGAEAAKWLVKNRVINGVGTDTLSLDAGNNVNIPAHITILSENIYGLENVYNLGKLPASGARVYVFPIKIKDGSGGPTRIIAEWDDLGKDNVTANANCFHISITLMLCLVTIVMMI